jgi:DNA-binding protein
LISHFFNVDILNLFFEFPPDALSGLVYPLIVAIILAILGAIAYSSRRRISNWWFGRKVNPHIKQAIDVYQKIVLPESDVIKPKVKIIEEKSKMPSFLPFGYLFIPKGQEMLIWDTLIAYLPISCSLKRVRVLFDQSLRESLFDVLSYQLGMQLGKSEIAVAFRDSSLAKHKDDYEAMEKIYSDGKLTTIILMEASIRFKKTGGNVTVSDVDEFSKLVRKIAQIDAMVIRVGTAFVPADDLFEKKRNLILLARGTNISKAVVIANELREKGCEMYPQNELGFSNPEIGTWHFEGEKSGEKSFIRIWLKWKQKS